MGLNIAAKRITGRQWFDASTARVQTMARQIARRTLWPGTTAPSEAMREDWAADAVVHLCAQSDRWQTGDWHDWAFRVMDNHIKNLALSEWRKASRTALGIEEGDSVESTTLVDAATIALSNVNLSDLHESLTATHYEAAAQLIERDFDIVRRLIEGMGRGEGISDYEWREGRKRIRQAIERMGTA